MNRCKACGQPVRWVYSTSGKLMQLDPGPLPDGVAMLLADGRARVVPDADREQCVAPLYRSHFPHCANAPPLRALSLTQPWAWLVVHAGKLIENRTWHTRLRGRFLVHAAKAMTNDDWMFAYDLARDVGGLELANTIPGYDALERGGIIGSAELVDELDPTLEPVVPWHMAGQFGFVLRHVAPLPFYPCKGSLGFWGSFRIREGLVERTEVAA
jgi:hypothetical protein